MKYILLVILFATNANAWTVQLLKENGSWTPKGYSSIEDLDVTEDSITATSKDYLNKCYADQLNGIAVKVTCENNIFKVTFTQGTQVVDPSSLSDNTYFSVYAEVVGNSERVLPKSSARIDKTKEGIKYPSKNKKQ